MPIYNSDTGEITKAYFFTTCIGVSSLVFIKAYPNTKKESYIDGNVSAFNYYGATPLYLTPDNDKSAVTRVCKYDPVINPTFFDMANYYGAAVLPARVARPKDKGSVEKAVLDSVERNVINRLRHYHFFSIEELNDRIAELLTEINNRPFQKEPGESRLSKFLEIDRPAMRDLPQIPYIFPVFKISTVHMDSHIEIDHKCYSVPYKYIG